MWYSIRLGRKGPGLDPRSGRHDVLLSETL